MRVIIDSMIRCFDVPIRIRSAIKDVLTIKNPEFSKKKAMGIPTWGISAYIKLYEYNNNVLIIPRGFARNIRTYIPENTFIYNETFEKQKIDFDSRIKLYDYQKHVILPVINAKQGVVVAPCGSGKTEMALQIAASFKQPTLWLTHTKDLIEQAKERARIRLNLTESDIGIIAGEKFKIGEKITFGMVQTMSKRDLSNIVTEFGTVIIDECHHCFINEKSFGQFNKVISQFPARYRIGITASEHRSDGLIETMYHIIGPKIYEITQDELNGSGKSVIPSVEYIPTDFEYVVDEGCHITYVKMIEAMAKDEDRNALLIKSIIKNMASGDLGIVMADRLEHLAFLYKSVKNNSSLKCAFINGETNKNERESILQQMRKKQLDLLFATYTLVKEGLDIPLLNNLFLCTPKRDQVIIQQAVGRIMRYAKGKNKAVVYDFFDKNITSCIYQARARKAVYKRLGCLLYNAPIQRKSDAETQLCNILENTFKII